MDNKYVNRAKISEAKFRQLVRLFAMDLTATQISELTGLNRNTVNKYLKGIRQRIAEYCRLSAVPSLQSMNAQDLSGPDVALLGILEEEGVIFTCLLTSEKAQSLKKTLTGGEAVDMWTSSYPFCLFDMLIEPVGRNRLRLFDEQSDPLKKRIKFNRIEGFIGYTQSRLEKFKGLHTATLLLHLKESEFRYNHPSADMYHLLLSMIRKDPLF